jgi:CheY-like chemotaxis protein
MDIQMPGMDGYTVTRLIRDELGLRDLPVFAVTAHARTEDREKSRLAGMAGHLVKPLDVDELLAVMANVGQAPLPCVDRAAALMVFGGDSDKLNAMLRKFVLQHGDDVAQARSCFNAQDTEGAIGLVHGLRGVASFLHVKALAGAAGVLEAALLDGPPGRIPALFDELQAAMDRLQAFLAG